jgi:DNA-directed RNA polymerase subunit E"
MAKKRACKNCAFITEEDTCPHCGSNNFANTIIGKMIIINPDKSKVAESVSIDKPGEYAIKMR